MNTAQRMVDEAAERAFAKSKIRDKDGKLVEIDGFDTGVETMDDTRMAA